MFQKIYLFNYFFVHLAMLNIVWILSSNSADSFWLFLALPAVLAHSGAISIPAMAMSIIGGLLIYGTIVSFSMFFREQEEF